MKRRTRENVGKNADRRTRAISRLEKKAAELNRRYPDKTYEIDGFNIVRRVGSRPHRISKKSDKYIKTVAEAAVRMIEAEQKGA